MGRKTNYLNSTTENYNYDAIYQLQQVTQAATTTESYTYDEVGNRLSSQTVGSYNYNSSNQLTSADGTTFTYDNNGNTLTKSDTNGQTTYAWDVENRLTSVTLANNGGVVSFKYDPFGRRIQKSGPSGTTIYVYDGANAIEELTSAGAVSARYVQGSGIDEPLARSASGISYYNADGLGSITSLDDASGTPTATFVYGAFGVLSTSSGSTTNSYRYTAREYDQDTGLYYYRARYYDPSLGRFISEDPLAIAGIHGFSYVGNQPTSFVDSSGLLPQGPETMASDYPYDILEHTLQRIRDFLPKDSDCLRFLCTSNGNVMDTISVILNNHLIGAGWIVPTVNADGSFTVTNAQTPGLAGGQMIAVNLWGSFFSTSYQGRPLHGEGGFRPASAGTQGFILLHELAHVLSDTTGSHIFENDAGSQEAVNRNNESLLRNCKKLINLLGGKKK
jgi:RHS repeat-associated protein